MDVVIVLPTYNEVATLEAIATAIVGQGAGVLVVDDGSPDGTGELADQLSRNLPAVSVLHRPRKEGLGRALVAGYRAALASGSAIVGQIDADGSHDPADLIRLIEAIDQGAGMAIGSRYVPGGSSAGLARGRSMLSRLGNQYARVMLGLPIRDATSGLRAFRAEVLASIDPATVIAQGYAFQIETTWRAHRQGVDIAEIPIAFRARQGGSSKMGIAIPLEATALVTRWGLQRLVGRAGGSRSSAT